MKSTGLFRLYLNLWMYPKAPIQNRKMKLIISSLSNWTNPPSAQVRKRTKLPGYAELLTISPGSPPPLRRWMLFWQTRLRMPMKRWSIDYLVLMSMPSE